MKVSKLFRSTLLVAALLVVGSAASMAQGRSATVSGFGLHAATFGAGIQYAITPSIQLMGTFNLRAGDVPTQWTFSPWVKFLLEGAVNPVFYAGLDVATQEVGGVSGDESVTTLSIGGGTGLQYYINPNFGAFALVELVAIGLSDENDGSVFGVQGGRVGIEWFLAP